MDKPKATEMLRPQPVFGPGRIRMVVIREKFEFGGNALRRRPTCFKTAPATLAGARTLVQHLAVITDSCLPEDVRDLVMCLARSPVFTRPAQTGRF
jgi:hypothetical protein